MKKILKKIFIELKQDIGSVKYYFIFFFGFVLSIVIIIEPIFFGKVIDELELYYTNGGFDIKKILIICLFWTGFIVLQIFLQYIYRHYLIDYSLLDNYSRATLRYSKKIYGMTLHEYLNKEVGKINKVLYSGTEGIISFLYGFFYSYYLIFIQIIAIVIIILSINLKLGLLAISMLPLMIIFGYFTSFKLAPKQEELEKHWEKISSNIGEATSNFSIFKSYTLEKDFFKRLKKITKYCFDKQIKISSLWSMASIYTSLMVMISRLLVLGFGMYFISTGEVGLSELFVIFSYIGWIYFPVSHIFNDMRNAVKNLSNVKRLYDEFENVDLDSSNDGGIDIDGVKGKIEFKDVDFGYGNKKIIKKLNIKISPGEKVAFVGNTGAGKSTILNLLFRFWDINSGDVLLDGVSINKISKKSLRSHIGLVAQDNTLFNMSIKDNLLFAKPNATDKELEDALKKSEAGFVFKLDKGINTIIGERGLKLSGGEKQRLSIARLFLKNPEILVLDEATSALDNKTEKQIQRALDKLMKGRTSIVVAHRLSTIQNADKIYMLESGKVVETGNYYKLMKNKSKFYELANPSHLIIN